MHNPKLLEEFGFFMAYSYNFEGKPFKIKFLKTLFVGIAVQQSTWKSDFHRMWHNMQGNEAESIWGNVRLNVIFNVLAAFPYLFCALIYVLIMNNSKSHPFLFLW